jgi:hypothetical protein
LQEVALKPVAADLRKLTRYKFVVYLPGGDAWSSSLKRLAASGSALLMPRNNPHETWVSRRLEDCHCLFYYDWVLNDSMCTSIEAIVRDTPDAVAEEAARKLLAFVRANFTAPALDAALLATLREAAATAPPHTVDVLEPGWERVSCESLLRNMTDPRWAQHVWPGWQVPLWFNSSCGLLSGDYLQFMPL